MKKVITILILIIIYINTYANIVILLGKGQSNFGGGWNDSIPADSNHFKQVFSRCFIMAPFSDSSFWLDNYPRLQNYQVYKNSSYNDAVYIKDRWGFEVSLLYYYLDTHPNDTVVYLKNPKGGASVSVFLRSGGDQWANYYYASVLKVYNELKYRGWTNFDFKYFPDVHGETDADDQTRANNYKSNQLLFYVELNQFIHEISQKLGLSTDTTYTVLLSDLKSSHPYDTTIQRVNSELADENSWIKLISVDNVQLGGDFLHYDSIGKIQLGNVMGDTIYNIEN